MQLTHFVPFHHLGSPVKCNHHAAERSRFPPCPAVLYIVALYTELHRAPLPHLANVVPAVHAPRTARYGGCLPRVSDDTYLLRIRTLTEEADSLIQLFAQNVLCCPSTRADGRVIISSVSPRLDETRCRRLPVRVHGAYLNVMTAATLPSRCLMSSCIRRRVQRSWSGVDNRYEGM